MATMFFNGYAAPALDEALLAQYPYQLLEPNVNEKYEYTFRGAKSPWFVWYNSTTSRYRVDCGGAENFFCRFVIADEAWDSPQVFTASPWQLNGSIYWANHDVTMGSESGPGTEVYLAATEALPAAPVTTPGSYAITKERLTGLADQVRRITGTSGELTPAQMQTALEGVSV